MQAELLVAAQVDNSELVPPCLRRCMAQVLEELLTAVPAHRETNMVTFVL